jgi:hypothetical protein
MSPEQLEFILTQYLDGTLAAGQVDAIERALEADPRARELHDEHERLTALLRAEPLPEMNWDELARDLSAVVTGTVDEESKAQDRKLNAMLKNLPPLPEVRWDALAGQISSAVDAELERADSEDEKLDQFLKGIPTPAVNWDKLAGTISKAIAAENGEAQRVVESAEREERPAVVGRIGWVRAASRLAMAACVVLAATLGIRFYMHGGSSGVVTPVGPQVGHSTPTAVAIIKTPEPEVSNKPAVAEITIGPSKAYVASADQEMYRSGVASRSAVVIASPVASDDDGDRAVGLGFE